jgi:hypothetical protein
MDLVHANTQPYEYFVHKCAHCESGDGTMASRSRRRGEVGLQPHGVGMTGGTVGGLHALYVRIALHAQCTLCTVCTLCEDGW